VFEFDWLSGNLKILGGFWGGWLGLKWVKVLGLGKVRCWVFIGFHRFFWWGVRGLLIDLKNT
jgi:hypothetical protein